MKKNKKSIFIRYEFSNEKGRPEGGDILEFSSLEGAQEFTAEILGVALGDKVAVNLTIGTEKPFIGFLGAVGLSQDDVKKEMVASAAGRESAAPAKTTSKKATKKTAKKAAKKSAKKASKKASAKK